jgi:hypothetical protein
MHAGEHDRADEPVAQGPMSAEERLAPYVWEAPQRRGRVVYARSAAEAMDAHARAAVAAALTSASDDLAFLDAVRADNVRLRRERDEARALCAEVDLAPRPLRAGDDYITRKPYLKPPEYALRAEYLAKFWGPAATYMEEPVCRIVRVPIEATPGGQRG